MTPNIIATMREQAISEVEEDITAWSGQGGRILIADDNPQNIEVLRAVLALAGYEVITASDGEESLRKIREGRPHLVVLDARMPKASGYDVCAYLRTDERTRLLPIILTDSQPSAQDVFNGLEAGCNEFLKRPVNEGLLLATIRSLLQAGQLMSNMINIEDVLTTLSRASEVKEGYSKGHVNRVAAYALFLAETKGLSSQERASLRKGAILHDIGKLGVKESVLAKEGSLTAEEREEIKLHTSLGVSICKPLGQDKAVLDIIRHHHERFDGSGYPAGLKGEAIPLVARVVTVADSYDAMTHDRPYRKRLSYSEALQTIKAEAGKQFDPSLALTFFSLMKSNPKKG